MESMSENSNIYHAVMRNGCTVRYREMVGKEKFGPWHLLGWFNHNQQFFSNGDPELWKLDGKWREDGTDSEFDIIQVTGAQVPVTIGIPPSF